MRSSVSGEYLDDLGIAEMPRDQFAEDVPEVGGQIEVSLLVKLLLCESGPVPVDFASLDASS